jgi:hypothetical protein
MVRAFSLPMLYAGNTLLEIKLKQLGDSPSVAFSIFAFIIIIMLSDDDDDDVISGSMQLFFILPVGNEIHYIS